MKELPAIATKKSKPLKQVINIINNNNNIIVINNNNNNIKV